MTFELWLLSVCPWVTILARLEMKVKVTGQGQILWSALSTDCSDGRCYCHVIETCRMAEYSACGRDNAVSRTSTLDQRQFS